MKAHTQQKPVMAAVCITEVMPLCDAEIFYWRDLERRYRLTLQPATVSCRLSICQPPAKLAVIVAVKLPFNPPPSFDFSLSFRNGRVGKVCQWHFHLERL